MSFTNADDFLMQEAEHLIKFYLTTAVKQKDEAVRRCCCLLCLPFVIVFATWFVAVIQFPRCIVEFIVLFLFVVA